MTSTELFEDFSGSTPSGDRRGSAVAGDKAESEAKRAAFDEGYKCGWQDGAAAKEDEAAEIRENLSTALQELNFTYFEARQHILTSVRPVLQAMVDAILPQLMADSLGGRVVELLGELADKAEPEITIVCAPQVETMLRELVQSSVKFPVQIETEDTLTPTQAVLHLNEGQTRIDLDETLETIRTCVNDFFNPENSKEAKYG